jgi:hypothetical protein
MSLAVKDDGSAADLRLVHLPLVPDSKDNEEDAGRARGFLLSITLRCLLAVWFQALLHGPDEVLLHAVVSRNSLHPSVFRKSGLLGRCWVSASQVAGSLS